MKKINSKNILIFVLVILVAMLSFGVYKEHKLLSLNEKIYPYKRLISGKKYVDNYFGYSLDIPNDGNQYVLGEGGDFNGFFTTINIGVLNNNKDMTWQYPAGRAGILEVTRFQIVPSYSWKSEKGICDKSEGPCFENIVIASSTDYVFSTYYPRPNLDSEEAYILDRKFDFDVENNLKVFEVKK